MLAMESARRIRGGAKQRDWLRIWKDPHKWDALSRSLTLDCEAVVDGLGVALVVLVMLGVCERVIQGCRWGVLEW